MEKKKKKQIKPETLSQKAKKKKDFFIIGGLIVMVLILVSSITSFFFKVKTNMIYKQKQSNVLKNKDLKLIPHSDYKENWAISVENSIKTQQQELKTFIKTFSKKQNNTKKELKNMIIDSIAQQKLFFLQTQKQNNKKIEKLQQYTKSQIEAIKSQIKSIKNTQKINTQNNNRQTMNTNSIIIGDELLPKQPTQKQPTQKQKTQKQKIKNNVNLAINEITGTLPAQNNNIPKVTQNNNIPKSSSQNPIVTSSQTANNITPQHIKPKLQLVDLSVGNNQQLIAENKKRIAKAKQEQIPSSYYVATGLSQAYLITGVYAPVFSAGNTEPLPVLLQASGDILIANNDTASIDNCFLIGSAKGNMNSQTADIRLVKISCSIDGGKYFIEGPISGWVIGENGIPGVHGTLLYKNGAFISKTFLAGFLQTFSQAFAGSAGGSTPVAGNNSNSTNQAVKTNIQNAAFSGAGTVFGKIGNYYLKMAEQIFPVIEVKPGRTVDVLLKGGDTLNVRKVNKADISTIEENAEKSELLKKRQKANSIAQTNVKPNPGNKQSVLIQSINVGKGSK